MSTRARGPGAGPLRGPQRGPLRGPRRPASPRRIGRRTRRTRGSGPIAVHRRVPHACGHRLVRRLPAHARRDRRLVHARRDRQAQRLDAAAGAPRGARGTAARGAVKHLQFWFDPVSPYACLAFEQLPQALEGLSYGVDYRPVLFAGLLKHWGQKGPAEIEPKRGWTFRQVAWHAHRLGLTMATPVQHPFNPLALLRLLLACAPEGGTPNRRACELVLRHVWTGGADANDPQRLAALAAQLATLRDPAGAAVKQAL